jgi:hypothetical protein
MMVERHKSVFFLVIDVKIWGVVAMYFTVLAIFLDATGAVTGGIGSYSDGKVFIMGRGME